jgi:ornithine cyclodeaminase
LVRKIKNIRVWGRDFAKAEALAGELNDKGFSTEAIADLQEAQTGAHIVCATTHSPDPVVISNALSPGTHVNSVGVNVDGREVDAATVARAALIAVESRQAALAPPEEAGANDLTWAIRDGVIQRDTAFVELGELLEGAPSRTDDAQITLYKGVGAAVEDAAAAWLVLQRTREAGIGRSIQ